MTRGGLGDTDHNNAFAVPLPPGVVCVSTTRLPPTDAADDDGLAAETALVANAAPARAAEFRAGRRLARQALRRLGLAAHAIAQMENGAPRWPDGVVGSITHCPGLVAAAVAREAAVVSIGVDAEARGATHDDLAAIVLTRSERDALTRHPRDVPDPVLVHFSAKESFYKAWTRFSDRWLDHADVTVALRPDGTFTAPGLAWPRAAGAGAHLGLWALTDTHVCTAYVVLAADGRDG